MKEQDRGWNGLSGKEGASKISSPKPYRYTSKPGRLDKSSIAQASWVTRGFAPHSKRLPLLIRVTCLLQLLHREK